MRSKNALINLYETAWPKQESRLHEQLYSCEDQQKIMQFKKHIEKYSHQNRYKHIILTPAFYYFPGSRIVYTSPEFRRLVSVVEQCINRLKRKEEIKYQDLIRQMFIFSCSYESMLFFIFFMLIARVLGTKQDDPEPFFHPYNRYRSIPMEDVRGKIGACRNKFHGASPGEVCTVGEHVYHMKKILPPSKRHRNNQIMGAYNHLFLNENVGIKVSPETAFFCMGKEKVSCYFSSKQVEDFLEARSLCKKHIDGHWCEFDRQKIIDKVGERAIAELAVAHTYIWDLHAKNWGYRTKVQTPDQNRLVILDTDQAPERDLKKHIAFVHKQFSTLKLGISLRLADISYMKNIYLDMQKKPVTTLHESVDMPPKLYKALLEIFIEACDKTILAVTSRGSAECDDCNREFAKYVLEIGMNYPEEPNKEEACEQDVSTENPQKKEKEIYHYRW